MADDHVAVPFYLDFGQKKNCAKHLAVSMSSMIKHIIHSGGGGGVQICKRMEDLIFEKVLI